MPDIVYYMNPSGYSITFGGMREGSYGRYFHVFAPEREIPTSELTTKENRVHRDEGMQAVFPLRGQYSSPGRETWMCMNIGNDSATWTRMPIGVGVNFVRQCAP